jgi:hypothetical protein
LFLLQLCFNVEKDLNSKKVFDFYTNFMIIFQWNLVCSKQFYPTFALVVFGLSGLFGMLLFGFIQDGSVYIISHTNITNRS